MGLSFLYTISYSKLGIRSLS